MNYDAHVQAIEAADLPLAEYRAARRLLDRALHTKGYLHLETDECVRLCGVNHWGSATRIFRRLATAGIIEFHSNSRAYVRFIERAESVADRAKSARDEEGRAESVADRAYSARDSGEGRAESVSGRAESVVDRADLARDEEGRAESVADRADSARDSGEGRAESVSGRAESVVDRADLARPPHTGARASWQAIQLQAGRQEIPACLPAEGGAGETAQPEPDAAPNNSGYRLLTDPEVRLDASTARRLAADYDLDELLRQVMRLRRDIETGNARSWAALAARLKRGFAATITDADRQSDLYRRHAPSPWATEGWVSQAAEDEDESAPAEPGPEVMETEPDPEPQVATARAQWERVQQECALQGDNATGAVQDMWVVTVEPGCWTLGIADAFRFDWVVKKLSKQLERKLAVVVGQPVKLAFEVRPRPSVNKHLSGKERRSA
jgi:hypothetical protein